MSRVRATLLFLLALCGVPFGLERPASAAPDRKQTEAAREHGRRGYVLYQVGKYREAAVEFEEAYSVLPEAGLLYNAAQAARLGGELSRAQTLYSSYVSFHPDGANLADARNHLEKIEATLKAEAETRRPPPAAHSQRSPHARAETPVSTPPNASAPARASKQSDRPLYRRWWLWTAVAGGVAVLATGVTLGVVLTRPAPIWNNVPDLGPGVPATSSGALRVSF